MKQEKKKLKKREINIPPVFRKRETRRKIFAMWASGKSEKEISREIGIQHESAIGRVRGIAKGTVHCTDAKQVELAKYIAETEKKIRDDRPKPHTPTTISDDDLNDAIQDCIEFQEMKEKLQ